MATLRMEMKNGAVVFEAGSYMNDEAIGQLPADVKRFLADRTRLLTHNTSTEDLFEVTLTYFIKEQVENLWSRHLGEQFDETFGPGAWDAIKSTLIRPAEGDRPEVLVENLDVYFFVNKPLTTAKLQVYAPNAIEAGKLAKSLVYNAEDVRVIGVQMIPATGKRK